MNKLSIRLKRAGGLLLDVLFPRRCHWCNKVVGFTDCCVCKNDIESLALPCAPIDLIAARKIPMLTNNVYACYFYEGGVQYAILRLKFENQKALAVPLAAEMAMKFTDCGLASKYDALVPVPISAISMRKRGFNQTVLLARQINALCGIPLYERLLLKTKETRSQMKLSREERLVNVVGAYKAINRQEIKGRRFLLVDDVLTTGSTLNECARTLLQAGASTVGALCIATVRPAQR